MNHNEYTESANTIKDLGNRIAKNTNEIKSWTQTKCNLTNRLINKLAKGNFSKKYQDEAKTIKDLDKKIEKNNEENKSWMQIKNILLSELIEGLAQGDFKKSKGK